MNKAMQGPVETINQELLDEKRKANLQAHYDRVQNEIAKVNRTIMDTPNIPAKELVEHHKRLQGMADAAIYLRNLFLSTYPGKKEVSPIVTPEGENQLKSV